MTTAARTLTQLDEALAYLRRGWSIIPIKPGTKEAAIKWQQYQTLRPTETQLRRWFGGDKPKSMAVIFGDVSGGLVCRDFDRMDAYDCWATEHPQLARELPTVATGRPGRHVYALADVNQIRAIKGGTILKYDDGELRGGGYCLLPPSVHPSGFAYEWLTPLPDKIPVIDLHTSGFIVADAPKLQESPCCTQNVTQHTEIVTQHTQHTQHTHAHTAFSGHRGEHQRAADVVFTDAIEMAIASTLPTGAGQRNQMLFELVRHIKAIPELADAPLSVLKPIVKRWHTVALPYITTKDFATSWLDFCHALTTVKYPIGKDPVHMAAEIAKTTMHDMPKEAEHYADSPGLLWLVALCRELQAYHGDKPFFLSCRTVAQLLTDVDHMQANRWLRVMQVDGILELVELGDMRGRTASSYRYLPTQGE